MHLKKIKIENYRSIKSEIIEFGSSVLLVGANDHGKTNILKAIDSFFNLKINDSCKVSQSGFYRLNKRRDSGPSPFRISVQISNLTPGLLHTKKKLKEVSITIQFYTDDSVRVSFNTPQLDKPSSKHNPKAFQKYQEILKHFKVSYVPTFRNIEDQLSPFASKSVLFDMLSSYLVENLQREQGGTTTEYRTVKKIKRSIDELLKDSFDDIKEATRKYLPSSYDKEDFIFSFIGNGSDEIRDRKLSELISKHTYLLNSKSGENVNELGSGIQQAITIGLLEKTCIAKNKSNILLLEEPESFLHPNAQRELFVKLNGLSKKPSTQMIFSTHSSPVLDATELDKICIVRKYKTKDHDFGTCVLQIHNNASQAIRKVLDEVELKKTFENSDVFFSELVILVEGFTDELVIKEILKKIAPELLYRISILNCSGNNKFLPMIRFLDSFKSKNGARIKWVILTDKDSHLRDVHKDFRSIGQNSNWDEVKKFVEKKATIDTSTGFINRNSARLLAKKINDECKKDNIFTLEADMEYALINQNNLNKVMNQIRRYNSKGDATLIHFKGIDKISALIGSRGPNLNWSIDETNKRTWKRADLHRSIICACNEHEISDELKKFINWIKEILKE